MSLPRHRQVSRQRTAAITNSDTDPSVDSSPANNHGPLTVHRMLDRFRHKLVSGLHRISRTPTSSHNVETKPATDTETRETTEDTTAGREPDADGKRGLGQAAAAIKQAEKFYTVDTEAYDFSSVLNYYATEDKRILPSMMKFFIGRSSNTDRKNSCCVHPLLDKLVVEFCQRVGMLEVNRRSFTGERMFLWQSRDVAQRALCGTEAADSSFINWVKMDHLLTDLQCLCARLCGCVARDGQAYPAHCCPDPDKINEVCAGSAKPRPRFVYLDRQEVCQHVYLEQDFGRACTVKGCKMFGKRLCSCFQLDMFIPDTIALATKQKFEQVLRNLETKFYGEQRWLIRASSLKGGNGVQLIDTASELETFMRYDIRKRLRGQFFVLQRLPRSPLLHNGRRFELRMFLLVAVLTDRRVVAFIHPGYMRLAQMPYQASSNDLRCHLAGPCTWDPDYNFYKKRPEKSGDIPEQGGPPPRDTAEATDADYCLPYSEARQQLNLPPIACDPALDAELRSPDASRFLLRLSRIANCLAGQVDSLVCCRPGSWQLFGLDLVLDTDRDVWLHDVMAYPCRDEPDPRSATQSRLLPAVLTESLALVLELNQRDQDTRGRSQWLDLPDVPVNRPGLIATQKNFVWMYSTDPERLICYKPQRKRTKPPHWYNCWRIVEDFNDYILYLKNHRMTDFSQVDTDSIIYGRKSFNHSAIEQMRQKLPKAAHSTKLNEAEKDKSAGPLPQS